MRAQRRPQPLAFPAGVWIVDATIHVLAEETQRIWDMEVHKLAVYQSQKLLAAIRFRNRHVRAESQCVVSIHP